MINEFTKQLLNYSAERDDCIGRPERWGQPPPLVVNTPLHEEMSAFADEVWKGRDHLIWYFLVGGPGNGKSEAVGAFVRRLQSKALSAGHAPVFNPSTGHHGGSIAYDFQETLPGGEMWLLQDVSVPKTSGSDPANDLLATLDLCAVPGASLLACANRGMLLRSTRVARAKSPYAWLVPILEKIDQQSQEGAVVGGAKWFYVKDGKQIEIRVWPLDHESVLFGHGNGNPWAEPANSLFDQIITKAVGPENWESKGCSDCIAQENCPMFGDAIWLRDEGRRRSSLKILRNAEVLSGQRIVLREALGLVSMVLVGCPSDFVENSIEVHPCEWVKSRLLGKPARPKDEQALLELVSRRIYQDLFGRSAPTGLALDRAHNRRDEWVLKSLLALGDLGEVVEKAIKEVDNSFPKQAGPLRLVGKDGILNEFDPAKDPWWCSKHGLSSDGNIADLRKLGGNFGLENHLGILFQGLEDAVKALEPYKDQARSFASIYRWASTLYLRISGTSRGEVTRGNNLSDYLALLQQPALPIQAVNGQQTTLRELMKGATETGERVRMAPEFSADLPSLQLKPEGARPRSVDSRWPANDLLLLQVSPFGNTSGSHVVLTAATFLDTWRKQVLEIAEWNISPAMEKLMRAWREDFMVTKAQFRNLETIEHTGSPPLEFEFLGATNIQVRTK
jgi:hypothetical protein